MTGVASLRSPETTGSYRMADVEIVASRRSCAADSDTRRLWILPELWKTPESPETDRTRQPAFSTTPWTGGRPPTGSTAPTTTTLSKRK